MNRAAAKYLLCRVSQVPAGGPAVELSGVQAARAMRRPHADDSAIKRPMGRPARTEIQQIIKIL